MLEGACHCGKVKWKYELPIESVTACNCTVCRRYGALWAYGKMGQGISVLGETKTYARNNKVIDFHFCADCGCVTHYVVVNTKRPEEIGKAAVNLRTVSTIDKIANLPIDHFDGLDKFDDLPRDHRTVKDLWF